VIATGQDVPGAPGSPDAGPAEPPPRPHRLAVMWRLEEGSPGARECRILTVRGALRLNASAAAIWERLDGRRDERALAASLRDLYPDAPLAELEEGVAELLGSLVQAGAVVRGWRPLDPCPAARAGLPWRAPVTNSPEPPPAPW
jgi:hypothetical protein